MTKKIILLALCSMLVAPCSAVDAQQAGKIFRIGVLDPSTATGSAALWEAFRQELSKLGWNEGKNVTIEYRFAEQKRERLPDLAAELVRRKVDLLVVPGRAIDVGGEENEYYYTRRNDKCWLIPWVQGWSPVWRNLEAMSPDSRAYHRSWIPKG